MSEQSKHPTPWRADDDYSPGCIVDARGATVCVGDDYAIDWSGIGTENHRKRVLACVNACAPLPTEALESGALGEAIQALSDAATPPGTLSRRTIRIRAQEALSALGKIPKSERAEAIDKALLALRWLVSGAADGRETTQARLDGIEALKALGMAP